MKRLKKHLALLAAAALALTLLAGCTVRPGPDGNIIIVPEEDDYIPAPPVVGQPPEEIGTVTWEQESIEYTGTQVSSAQVELENEIAEKSSFCLVRKVNDGEDIRVKYNGYEYGKTTNDEGISEVLYYNGRDYIRENGSGKFRKNGDDRPTNSTVFQEVVPDFTELLGGAKWHKGSSSKGFQVETSKIEQEGFTIVLYVYFQNGKFAGTDLMGYMGTELVEKDSMRVEYRTDIPEEIKSILEHPEDYIEEDAPIPPETPAPVN